MGYNAIRGKYKAGREALPTPHAPMQEHTPPTQQYITAPTLIITDEPPFYKGGFEGLCLLLCGVGFLYPAPLSVCLDGTPKGDGASLPYGPDR